MRRRLGESGYQSDRKYKLGMPIFIVVIMVLSVLGFSIGSFSGTNDNEFSYNGYSFELDASDEQNPLWKASKEGADNGEQEYDFHFRPEEVLDIVFEGKVNYPSFTLVDNPEENISISDLQLIALSKFEMKSTLEEAGKIVSVGFMTNSSGVKVTCENASENSAVVVFEISNLTQISNANNCITIAGNNGREVVRAKEMFLFRLLGIA